MRIIVRTERPRSPWGAVTAFLLLVVVMSALLCGAIWLALELLERGALI